MSRFFSVLFICSAVLVLLVLTQVLSGTLSLLSFERSQLGSVISGYDAVGTDLAAKIERGLALGKPLRNFVGIESLLQQGAEIRPDLDDISVLDSEGQPLFALGRTIVPPAQMVARAITEDDRGHHLRHGDYHFLVFALGQEGSDLAGYLVLAFADADLDRQKILIAQRSTVALAVISLVAAIFLFCGLIPLFSRFGASPAAGKSVRLLLLLVLGGTQLLFSAYSIKLFQGDYLRLTEQKALTVARLMVGDVEELLRRGLTVTTLFHMDKRLQQTVDRVPEIALLAIENIEEKVLYSSGSTAQTGATMLRHLDLHGAGGEVVGRVVIGLDGQVVRTSVREIIWDSLTVVALSLLLVYELASFLFGALMVPVATGGQKQKRRNYGGHARAAVFLYIFAATLCHSFIPLYAAELYQPLWRLSKEMVLGLPLTLEMLGGGLVLIPAGWWIDRRGWHYPFLLGIMISAAGTFLSGYASGPQLFMAARLITGCGYGLAWMAGQGYVLLHTDERKRAQGISGVVAGIFSGIICGNGIGALIAERLGFETVFYIGAGAMSGAFLFPLILMRPTFIRPPVARASGHQGTGIMQIFTDRQLLLVFCCSLVPYSLTMVGLLYYVTPLYLQNLDATQSDIGRIIMLFGLCMIFIAPRVSRVADRRTDKRPLVIAGGLLASLSLGVFFVVGSMWGVVCSVLLFGISVAVSGASRNVMALNTVSARAVGMSQVMGWYRSVDKLGQALGGLVPAMLMMVLSIRQAMLVMGTGYLLLTLLLVWRLRDQSVRGGSIRKS